MPLEIRRTLLHVEDTFVDGGRVAERPLKLIAAVAILKNPWAGSGFVENLRPEIREISPVIGKKLSDMIVEAAGSGDAVEAYGKCSVVGMGGEMEHAAALIHTVPFGNQYRSAVGAKTYLAFSNTRGGANAPISIPLMDKHDGGRRSHYLTIQLSIPDAPAHDELIVALGASVGGRPHDRLGCREDDLREYNLDLDNPAGV
ncbi:amino acid synthesis family protein [Pelagibius sp. Alg239-R121]|uniref:amino acid synthesis family protein n=1 Tax=Pelagibius sp. Alg239-R121 TaxID=2993448 RepID=UPI0024A65EC2|nr:amino acid synthesis family protein [Pelagibius sp. Alg239-R121]